MAWLHYDILPHLLAKHLLQSFSLIFKIKTVGPPSNVPPIRYY